MREITLRPASIEDRPAVYKWLAQSDATAEMMGPPTFPDHPVPDFAEFCADYDDAAFAADGCFRMFIIGIDGDEAGVIHYWIQGRSAEVDMWIAERRHWGHGTGSRALRRIAEDLAREGNVDTLVIRPSARNKRAVAAYRKAGFETYDPARHDLPAKFVEDGCDYDDAVVLAMRLG